MPGVLEKIYNNINSLTTRSKTYDRTSTSKNSRKSTKKSTRKSLDSKKVAATRKIQTFMKKYRPKIRARFLNHICSDSGVCITFGKEIETIKKHFNGFNKFDYVSKIKRIGKESENGFVNEITYENAGYKSYAILKSAMEPDSDNLYFEYLVGNYVNKLNLQFPCFLETYGCFLYSNEAQWKNMINPPANVDLKKILKPFPEPTYAMSCKKSKHISLLIQHINGADSLDDMTKTSSFNDNELLYSLFQIYMALSCVADTFTHFDLHTGNVLVYAPVSNKYIEYHYHTKDGEEIAFKSKYMTKIIDYGRSFFEDNSQEKNGSSKNIVDNVCKSNDCAEILYNKETRKYDKHYCGVLSGYSWMNKPSDMKESYYISSSIRNMSHDLRTLYILKQRFTRYKKLLQQDSLRNLLHKVNYCQELYQDDDCFGTIENTDSGLPGKINNVIDAHDALLELVKDPYFVHENEDNYIRYEKLGDLHVYYDGSPMEFVEYVANKKTDDVSP
jgi:hypothetical protein